MTRGVYKFDVKCGCSKVNRVVKKLLHIWLVITMVLAVVDSNKNVAEVAQDGSSLCRVNGCSGLRADENKNDVKKVGNPLTLNTTNHNVVATQYAVRGEVLIRANEIEKKLLVPNHGYAFDTIIKCNIGNPQALGQKPISFIRQVLSLVVNPELLENDAVRASYPPDVTERALKYLEAIKSVGAYSASNGVEVVREEVAEFVQQRDQSSVPVDPENVFITAGASDAVEKLMRLFIRSPNDAVLTPIPQYPLYSALTTLMDGYFAPYYMGEETGWEMDMAEVKRAYEDAVRLNKTVRGMVVINPGNPTGSVLSLKNMKEIVAFCVERHIVLLADEVYQTNVYKDTPFISFRKVAELMGLLDENACSGLQLASFHSISKGMVGECGLRGGYVELNGFDAEVKEQLYKIASIKLCSNVPGQLAVGLMANPPKVGSPSYPTYEKETDNTFLSLRRRAKLLEDALNALPGIHCNPIQGAMYAFPQISLPPAFIEDAKKKGTTPDLHYSLKLLERTGIVIVPGSGFRQQEGTWHFRTTFLPPEEDFKRVIQLFSEFHTEFMNKWH